MSETVKNPDPFVAREKDLTSNKSYGSIDSSEFDSSISPMSVRSATRDAPLFDSSSGVAASTNNNHRLSRSSFGSEHSHINGGSGASPSSPLAELNMNGELPLSSEPLPVRRRVVPTVPTTSTTYLCMYVI